MPLSIATMFGQLCIGEGMLLACEKDGFKKQESTGVDSLAIPYINKERTICE